MIINDIDPVLFKIWIFEIRYYGIIYALGFLIAYLFLLYFIKKGKLKGIDTKKLDDLILYLLVGVVIGARLFEFIFYHPSIFWTDPLEIFKIWHGGLSFHGGLIGAVAATFVFSKKYKVNYFDLFDAVVIPASIALALGRIANYTNQELYGTITNIPWCVRFMAVDNLCRHPYQIYASISHFLMFGILILIYYRQKVKGTAFWSFVLMYGSFRFLTDFFREEPRLLEITMGQFLSLVMAGTAVVVFIRRRVKKKSKKVLI